jgi:threonine aldolase
MKMHLDGARCLNAAVYRKMSPAELFKDFDTINICLSKGLSCPIGSLLVGSHEEIARASVIRKLIGGQLR